MPLYVAPYPVPVAVCLDGSRMQGCTGVSNTRTGTLREVHFVNDTAQAAADGMAEMMHAAQISEMAFASRRWAKQAVQAQSAYT